MPPPRLFDRAALRRLHARGDTVLAIAAAFGVRTAAIYKALHGEGLTPAAATGRRAAIDLALPRLDTTQDHWEWPGGVTAGCPVVQGRTVARILWKHFVGDLATRQVLSRTCDAARCVRPSHHRVRVASGARGERRFLARRDRSIHALHESGLRPHAIAVAIAAPIDEVRERLRALGLRRAPPSFSSLSADSTFKESNRPS